MSSFFTSNHCTSNSHCEACRVKSAAGSNFRRNLLRNFTDITQEDFICPHGKPWGYKKDTNILVEERNNIPTLKQASSFIRAITSGTRITDLELIKERSDICKKCEFSRQDPSGLVWCKICGCKCNDESRIDNLASYEEKLPQYGCKHPDRSKGGWKR